MKLAVIVPVYNEVKTISDCLSQLVLFDIDELMVVDGGSQDGTQAVLQKLDIRWIAGRKGRAAQMNDGAACCSSDILLFLHVDTQLPVQAVDDIKKNMASLNVVGGRFDVRLDDAARIFRVIERMINWRSRSTCINTGDQAMFVRRHVFESMGGFPELPLMEDVALSHLLKRRGKVVSLHQQVTTSARRWLQHGVIRTVLLMWKLRFLYWYGIKPETLARMYRDAR